MSHCRYAPAARLAGAVETLRIKIAEKLIISRRTVNAHVASIYRSAFGLERVEWPGNESVEFHLSHGDWISLLRR